MIWASEKIKSLEIVKGMSLEVKSGEVVGLLGPNGAGKTTTFYMICGLVEATAGEVFFDDENISDKPLHERALDYFIFYTRYLGVTDWRLVYAVGTALRRKGTIPKRMSPVTVARALAEAVARIDGAKGFKKLSGRGITRTQMKEIIAFYEPELSEVAREEPRALLLLNGF